MIRLVTLPMLALVAAISTAAAEEGQRLSSDQMAKAVKSDSITVPTPGELFAALGKSGKNKLVRSIPRPNSRDLRQSCADRPQPRRSDSRWVHCRGSQGRSAGEEYRLGYHEARKSARSKRGIAQPRQ